MPWFNDDENWKRWDCPKKEPGKGLLVQEGDGENSVSFCLRKDTGS